MEAILKFNLPEENHEFKMAIDGAKWSSSMWELDQWIRSEMKYNSESFSENQYEVYKKIREKLYYIINENGITFED